MEAADVDDIYAYQSDPEVCRYLLYEPRTRAEVAEKVAQHSAARVLHEAGDYWQLAAVRMDDPSRVIGDIYFTIKDATNATCEIGWTLHPDHHGRGYMTEAATAVLDLGFTQMGMHRAIANLDPRNRASAALCARLGMRPEAHHVEDLWFKGQWADSAIFAILDREWAARTWPATRSSA
jgi:RimJ/RimL family protein N-acetyltransferase